MTIKRMQQRHDTAANWLAANPILFTGELGYETDTGKFKFGDNTTAWSALPYDAGSAPPWDSITGIPAPLAAGANVANGYAGLDGGGKIGTNQLPLSVMEYKGVWNASTNSPTLADGTGNTGDFYRVGTAAARNLGSGSITFDVGDYVLYNSATWEKSDTTDAVASVAGLTGPITASALKTALSLVLGTDVQAWDADLDALAGVTSAANKLPYFTGLHTVGLADFTAAGRALVDDADAAAQRTTLGLTIGTDIEAHQQFFFFVDTFAGADDDAKIAAVRTAMGSNPGVMILAARVYTLANPIGRFYKKQSIYGAGRELTRINYSGTGPMIDAYSDDPVNNGAPFGNGRDNYLNDVAASGPGLGGTFQDFFVDGTGSGVNSCAIKAGDMYGITGWNIRIINFANTGGKGVWLINRYTWTERGWWKLHIENCKQHVVFELAGGLESFNATHLWLDNHVKPDCDGIALKNGAQLYHSEIIMSGACISQASTNTGVAIRVGTNGASDASLIDHCFFNIHLELQGSPTNIAHKTIEMGNNQASPLAYINGHGMVNFLTTSLVPTWQPGNAKGHVAFTGKWNVDSNSGVEGVIGSSLSAGRDIGFRGGSVGSLGSGGAAWYLSSGNMINIQLVSGVNTIDQIDADTLARASTGETGSWDFILRQPSSGAAATITWPAAFTWVDGAAPTLSTTNNGIDVIRVITADFVNFRSKHVNSRDSTKQNAAAFKAVQTVSFTAVANAFYPTDATAANVTITMPTAPADGTVVSAMKVDATAFTVGFAAGGTDKFNRTGGPASVTPLTDQSMSATYEYKASTGIWYKIADSFPGGLPELTSHKGVANGYVPLNGSVLIDSTYLPSYVDDVVEAANFAALPGTGEAGKIYVTLDNNHQFRWSGSAYVDITYGGLAAEAHAATSKATPVDADELPLVDSAASNVLKKLTWANLKATLKTYFDSLATTLTNKTLDNSNTATLKTNGFTLQDSTDATKQGIFDLASVGTGVTRTYTLPGGGGSLVSTGSTHTLTNKRVTPRISTQVSSTNPAINTDNVDQHNLTAMAVNVASMTSSLTGTPTDGQSLDVRFKDDGTGRTIAWGASFTGTLLATTVAGKTHLQRLKWDAAAAKWAGFFADTAGY